jgi:hypothetical protein
MRFIILRVIRYQDIREHQRMDTKNKLCNGDTSYYSWIGRRTISIERNTSQVTSLQYNSGGAEIEI